MKIAVELGLLVLGQNPPLRFMCEMLHSTLIALGKFETRADIAPLLASDCRILSSTSRVHMAQHLWSDP